MREGEEGREEEVYFSTRVRWIITFVTRSIIEWFVSRVLTLVTLFLVDWVHEELVIVQEGLTGGWSESWLVGRIAARRERWDWSWRLIGRCTRGGGGGRMRGRCAVWREGGWRGLSTESCE